MLLSVVIPVYKVEKYLNECVDSIINQSFDDYEIILVDDGSPDKCPEICDEYANKYDFIKVIHKQNGGLSAARNTGIDAASGEYIMFLDSDDYWNPDVNVSKIIDIVRKKTNVEMFVLSSLDYIEGKGCFERADRKTLSNVPTDTVENYYKAMLNRGNIEVHAATKIIKKDFIINNGLYFTVGILSEDNDWMMRVLRVLNHVEIINEPLYIYRVGRPGSITNTVSKKNIVFLLEMIDRSIKYYKDNPDSKLKQYELCYCAYLWYIAVGLSNKVLKKDRKELKSLFFDTSCVCSFSNSKKTKICYKIYRIFGFNFLLFVLGSYLKIKKYFNYKKS